MTYVFILMVHCVGCTWSDNLIGAFDTLEHCEHAGKLLKEPDDGAKRTFQCITREVWGEIQ